MKRGTLVNIDNNMSQEEFYSKLKELCTQYAMEITDYSKANEDCHIKVVCELQRFTDDYEAKEYVPHIDFGVRITKSVPGGQYPENLYHDYDDIEVYNHECTDGEPNMAL